MSRWFVGRDNFGDLTRTIYNDAGNDIGRMDTPELAALVVEAVNEHHKTIESGKRVAAVLAQKQSQDKDCPACHGSGYAPSDPSNPSSLALAKCWKCRGTGRVRPCTNCPGTGWVAQDESCRVCGMTGLVPASEEL